MRVPEYYPPPRVEAWLTLPPGAVVARDDPDWMPWSLPEPRYPQVHSEASRRFRTEFGNQAAYDWGLEADRLWLTNKIMREVWSKDALAESFYAAYKEDVQ